MTSRKAVLGLVLVLCLLASMTLPLLRVEPALADATWQIQTVDSAGAKFTSLAFDSPGNPGISYYDGTNGDLKYAHWNGSSWDTATVDSSGDVGMSSSLAFDSSGNAAISYVDISSHHLKLARFNGSSWAAAIIDDSGRVYDDGTSLAFDHTGNPAISYCYWEDVFLGLDVWYVRYAHFNGTSWDKSNVKGGTGVYVGRYNSLAFDTSGNPSISYYNHGSYHLEYAHWTGLSWIVETIDSAGDVGMYTSLDFDLSGNPGITYYDYSNGNLKYTHWNGSAWSIETVDSAGAVGLYTSLAFDNAQNPAISYYDQSNGNLKYAYWSGVGWVIQAVDSTGDVGKFTSIAFDGQGNPGISYYDATNGDLKYAYLPLNQAPNQPSNTSPVDGATGVSVTPTIQSSAFSDPDAGDTHAASQWQITTTPGNYSSPVLDSDTDTSNLTTISIPSGTLDHSTTYYWHVRHQGNHGAWSAWSSQTSFATIALTTIIVDPSMLEEPAKYNFASAQGESELEVLPSGETEGVIYFYNVDGNRITHITLEVTEAPDNWEVEIDPPLHDIQVSFLGGNIIPVTENLHAEPTELSSEEIEDVPEGMICLTLPNELGDGIRGYALARVATTIIRVPESAEIGTSSIKISATAFWVGQTGAAAISQDRDFDFTVEVKLNQPPSQPSNTWPLDGATGVRLPPILQSSAFSDPDSGDTHAASQWQITATSGYYSSPVFDSGTDTSKLTSITISSGTLQHAITYYWRVRHQDNNGNWSAWSEETQFTTEVKEVDGGQNGEDGIGDWARENWWILTGAGVAFGFLLAVAISITLRLRRQKKEVKRWEEEGYRW